MKIKFDGNAEEVRLTEKCLEVYLGDYSPEQQYAASIMLHMLLKDKDYHRLMDFIKEHTGFRANDRNSSRVLSWKKKVKQRGKCEVCGSTKNLVAHHIIPWSQSIKGRTDVNNGQCLCDKCHKMMHNDVLWLDYMRKKVRGNERKE